MYQEISDHDNKVLQKNSPSIYVYIIACVKIVSLV